MNEPDQIPSTHPADTAATPHYPPPPPIHLEVASPLAAAFRPRSTHAVLGPSFWVFGALSWAYVVIGELVVSLGLPELLGALIVLSSTGYAWVVASGLGEGARFAPKQLLSLLFGCVLFFFLVVFAVSLLGSHSRSQASAVTLLLWFISVFALLLGRRLTPREPPLRSTGDRLRTTAIWTFAVIGTIIAMVSAMGRM